MKRGALIALLVIIVILLGLFLLGGFIYLQFNQEPYVPQKAYLKIDLSGPIAETAPTRFPGMASGALSIHDLWFHLERAARDEREADGVRKALSERTGGGLNAGRVAELGVAGGERIPRAQTLHVVQFEPEPVEVELRVLRHRRVPSRQHEPVATQPTRLGGDASPYLGKSVNAITGNSRGQLAAERILPKRSEPIAG